MRFSTFTALFLPTLTIPQVVEDLPEASTVPTAETTKWRPVPVVATPHNRPHPSRLTRAARRGGQRG